MLVFVFILGLLVGSFLNVLILRTWRGEEIISKSSYCYHCGKKIAWLDLLPVVSFIVLKGRCRSCHEKISWQYPLVELTTGLLFVSLVQKFLVSFPPEAGQPWADTLLAFGLTLSYLALFSLLLAMFVFDFKYSVIPDRFLYPALVISSVLIFIKPQALINHLVTGALAAGLFALLVLGSKGKAMGSGDIYLALIIGLLLGFPNALVAFVLAFFVGALVGLWQVIAGKKSLKTQIPFGPFLIGALAFVIIWGSGLVDLYLRLLGV